MGYRVGIDVGGTFTDLICVTAEGEVVLDKTPSTLDDQSQGVMRGLEQLAERFGQSLQDFCGDLDVLVHGTTTADNTMIEQDGAPTGLLATDGHRDEIELRRGYKEDIWDAAAPPPFAIAPRRARIPIPERLDHEGNVLLALDEEAVRKGVQRLRKLGVTSIGVCFLYSFVNPDHERRAREIILEEYPEVDHISLSHEVLPKAPEFERTSATLVNAYVAPKLQAYLGRLTERLRSAGYARQVVVMQATGGVMTPDYVSRRAVTLLGSGPAGGVLGAARTAVQAGIRDFVAVDMGGTSYDVGLVRDGLPDVSAEWNWRYRYYIALPMVDVQSVGAGGGSIASVRAGSLQVGPQSAGASPGPVCYGRRGSHPTVTDADVVLGYIPSEAFAGGRMTLDVQGAREAIEREIAQPLGIDVIEAAWGIERVVNATMADAVRRVLSTKGVDPRDLSLVAYGGNGPVHAWAQAQELEMNRVLIPRTAPAFSALGLLVADYLIDLVRAYVSPLAQADPKRIQRLAGEMADESAKELAPAELGDEKIRTQLLANVCYPGQNFDMAVPVSEGADLGEPDLEAIAERFHDLHEADRGYAFRNQEPLLRSLRYVAVGATPKPARLAPLGTVSDPDQARKGMRPAFFGDGFVETPVYDGPQLAPGVRLSGPALVEEPFTVVVVAPGQTMVVDEHSNYELRL